MTLITKNFQLNSLANEFASAVYSEVTHQNGGDWFSMRVGKIDITVAIVDGIKGIRQLVDSYALEALEQAYPEWEPIAIRLMTACVVNNHLTNHGREVWQSMITDMSESLSHGGGNYA